MARLRVRDPNETEWRDNFVKENIENDKRHDGAEGRVHYKGTQRIRVEVQRKRQEHHEAGAKGYFSKA